MLSDLTNLFAGATGDITIFDLTDPTNSCSSLDHTTLSDFAASAEDPAVDLVTISGMAIGRCVLGDHEIMSPSPSVRMPGAAVYYYTEAVPGQEQGEHFLPLSAIKPDLEPPRYQPDALNITSPGSTIDVALSHGRNRTESQGKWKTKKSTFGQFTDAALTIHKEGKKDGYCFLQGECAGGTRKAAAMVANYIIGIDLDSGAPLSDVMDAIIDTGHEAVIYTTHSHLKDISQIKRDHFLKWAGTSDPTPELCADYLRQVKGVIPEIAASVEILKDSLHTEEGVVILVKHKPMPKFRAVFPLSEPFVFAKRGGTQQDAIAEWKERYAGFASKMGFFFDETCVDPARLFYLPRHQMGSAHGTWRIAGKPINFDNYERMKSRRDRNGQKRAVASNPFTEFAGWEVEERDPSRFMVGDFNLIGWAKKSAKQFEIENFLSDMVPDMLREPRVSGNGGIHVECPFEAEHSSFGGQGTFVVNSTDAYDEGFENGFTFKCIHNACADRDRLDMIKGCIEDGWFTLEDLKDSRFCVELEQEASETGNAAPSRVISPKIIPEDEEGLLNYINDRHAVVIMNRGVVILREPKNEEDSYRLLTPTAFHVAEKNCIYEIPKTNGGFIRIQMSEEWLKSRDRREFDGIDFYPDGNAPSHIYNTFNGYPVQPKPGGSWALLKHHLLNNVCQGNEVSFTYLMTWIADIFQNPGKKPGVAVVITGKMGCGKTKLFEVLKRLLGRYATKLTHASQLAGKFNAQLDSKLVVFADEILRLNDAQNGGIVKDFITGRTVRIEQKGVDAFEARNLARLLIVSNEEFPVLAALDERRYFFLECGNDNIKDNPFFAALDEEMDDGGYEALMYDLLDYVPEQGWHSLYSPPKSMHLAAQQRSSLPAMASFYYELMQFGSFEYEDGVIELSEQAPIDVPLVDLRDAFAEYLKLADPHSKQPVTYPKISAAAQKWCNAMPFMRHVPGGKNQRGYVRFPSLKTCRGWFTQTHGLEFEEEPEITDTEAAPLEAENDNSAPFERGRLRRRNERND
jgi:hypothetical protein